MSNKLYPFVYNKQFETYIGQFMRVFSGFQYDTGKNDGVDGTPILGRIPVVYGPMERVVASVLNKRDNMTNRRIPLISVAMTSITPDPQNNRGFNHVADISTEGKETTRRSVRSLTGPAFRMNLSVSVLASSQTELFSIIENLLLMFNPSVTVRLTTDVLSNNTRSEIRLESIQDDITYPLSSNSRIVSMSMEFGMDIRLSYPRVSDDAFIDVINKEIIPDEVGDGENIDYSGITDTIDENDV